MAALSKKCGFIYSVYLLDVYTSFKGAKLVSNHPDLMSKKRANKIVFFRSIFSDLKKAVLNFAAATKKHQLFFLQKTLKRYKSDISKTLKAIINKPYKENNNLFNTCFSCFF